MKFSTIAASFGNVLVVGAACACCAGGCCAGGCCCACMMVADIAPATSPRTIHPSRLAPPGTAIRTIAASSAKGRYFSVLTCQTGRQLLPVVRSGRPSHEHLHHLVSKQHSRPGEPKSRAVATQHPRDDET